MKKKKQTSKTIKLIDILSKWNMGKLTPEQEALVRKALDLASFTSLSNIVFSFSVSGLWSEVEGSFP